MRRVLFVLLFFMFSLSSLHAAILIDRVVAIVGRDVITWSELYKSLEFEFSDQLRNVPPEERRKILQRYEKQYLERLIDLKVQINEARKMNIVVSEKEVDMAIDTIRNKYGLTEEEFKEAIEKQGLSYQEYKEKIYEQILVSKVENFAVRSKIIVTDEEIDSYLKNNRDLTSSEGYRLRQIFIPVFTEEDKTRAERKASEIMELLKKGEPFDAVAIRFSEGPNASRGGDLGFIKKSELAPEFLKVIENLQQGQFSPPFWSKRGLHILYLQERIKPDRAIRDRVREIVYEEKFNRAVREWIRSLRSKYFIEVKL